MVDEMEALRDYLILQEPLWYVAGSGIFCEEAPKGTEPPFILLESAGGTSMHMSPISYPLITTTCYGLTAKQAKTIDLTLREAIVNIDDSTGRIISAAVDNVGEIVVDRDWPEWFCCEAKYEMEVNNI